MTRPYPLTDTVAFDPAGPKPCSATGAGPDLAAPDSATDNTGGRRSGVGLVWGRHRACDEVAAELADSQPYEPALALRSYGPGCLAVGVAGPIDRAAVERLAGLLRDLRSHSTRELLLSLALLGPWHPHLARVIGQVRIQHLIDGARVELHDTPPALSAEPGLSDWSLFEWGLSERTARS